MTSGTTVLQPWVSTISLMQQSVLLGAVRGPDGMPKYGAVKMLLRWYRRCVLLSAMDRRILEDPYEAGGGSFTGPSLAWCSPRLRAELPWEEQMDELVSQYLQTVDALPHHFQLHFMHAAEILGYKHWSQAREGEDSLRIRKWWHQVYRRLVHDLHLWEETVAQMDERLGDNREGWLKRADPATQA